MVRSDRGIPRPKNLYSTPNPAPMPSPGTLSALLVHSTPRLGIRRGIGAPYIIETPRSRTNPPPPLRSGGRTLAFLSRGVGRRRQSWGLYPQLTRVRAQSRPSLPNTEPTAILGRRRGASASSESKATEPATAPPTKRPPPPTAPRSRRRAPAGRGGSPAPSRSRGEPARAPVPRSRPPRRPRSSRAPARAR